jgi:hypothetical protein
LQRAKTTADLTEAPRSARTFNLWVAEPVERLGTSCEKESWSSPMQLSCGGGRLAVAASASNTAATFFRIGRSSKLIPTYTVSKPNMLTPMLAFGAPCIGKEAGRADMAGCRKTVTGISVRKPIQGYQMRYFPLPSPNLFAVILVYRVESQYRTGVLGSDKNKTSVRTSSGGHDLLYALQPTLCYPSSLQCKTFVYNQSLCHCV